MVPAASIPLTRALAPLPVVNTLSFVYAHSFILYRSVNCLSFICFASIALFYFPFSSLDLMFDYVKSLLIF